MKDNERLMDAIGNIDADLVERAAEPPAVKRYRSIRWTAVIAAALALAVGLGLWWHVSPKEKTPVEVAPPTSLAEAKAAIAQGRYEDAYLYLLTDSSPEAVALLKRFAYVPMEMTGSGLPSNLAVDDKGNLLSSPVVHSVSGDGDALVDAVIEPDTKEATREEYTYDDKGRILTMAMVYMDGGKESREVYAYTYDTAGNMVKREFFSIGGKKEQTWVYTYDKKGRCIKEESSGEGYHSSTITYTYNEADQLLLCYETTEGSDGWRKTEYAYDANGNLVKDALLTSSGMGWTYEYTYDANGVQTSYSHTLPDNPNHWQKWHMEGNKKISESLEAEGHNYSKSISVDDKVIYGYFRRGSYVTETEYTYDAYGNRKTKLSWEENNYGDYTVYTYDDHNNLLKETQYTITDRDRPEETATLYRVRETYTYVYDDDGRILQQEHRDEDGKVTKTEYRYDKAGRLLFHKNIYDNDTWDSITHTYHKNGNVMSTERIKVDGSWKKETFDAEGRQLSMEDSKGQKYTYEWSLCYYTQEMNEQQRTDLEHLRRNAKVSSGDELMISDE